MLGDGGSQKEALRPNFNRSILMDFQGARISSDTGFLLLREMDERFDIIGLKVRFMGKLAEPVFLKFRHNLSGCSHIASGLGSGYIGIFPLF